MICKLIIQCEKTAFVKKDDKITITRDDKLIGYGTVIDVLEDHVLLKADENASKSLFEIFSEDIKCDFTFVNEEYVPK